MNTDLEEFMARTIGSADKDEMMRICTAFAELALHYREMWIGTTVAPDDNVALIVRTVKTVREGK